MIDEDRVYHLPLKDIFYDEKFNSRGAFTPQSVHDLARSIEARQLQSPVMVRPAKDAGIDSHSYHLVAGHRRFKAIEIFLQWETIPALIRSGMDDETARVLNLVENIDREDLSVIEEAKAIEATFGDMSMREIARRLNRGFNWVKYRLGLLKLSSKIQDYVLAGDLSLRDIELLLRVSPEHRGMEADKLVHKKQRGEPASVNVRRSRLRKTSEIKQMMASMLTKGAEGLGTYALAWAIGELDTSVFENYVIEVIGDENPSSSSGVNPLADNTDEGCETT
jgi:ParB family chromosome partitioning protein